MTSSELGDIVGNEPQLCYSEWEHFVADEAEARGIPSDDWQALEALDEELQEQAQDHKDHLEEMAYEDSLEGY